MDTTTLLADAKARFNHNSAKEYLKDKYEAKLIVAEQGGLWKADLQTILALSSFNNEKIVLIDTFGNPVRIYREVLLETLQKTYNSVMEEWYLEWKKLESSR